MRLTTPYAAPGPRGEEPARPQAAVGPRGERRGRGWVFRAHTDPELVVQWLGPRSTEMRIDHYDCRSGGSYRYVHTSDGNEYGFNGCFHEVRPAEMIIQTFAFEGEPDGVALERLLLEDLGGGRTRLTATSLVDSFEARDAMLASGMDSGIRESYQRLDELLAAS